MKIFDSTNFIRSHLYDKFNPIMIYWLQEYMMSSYFDKKRMKYAHIPKGSIEFYYLKDEQYLIVVADRSYNVSIKNFIKYVRNNQHIYRYSVAKYRYIWQYSRLISNFSVRIIKNLDYCLDIIYKQNSYVVPPYTIEVINKEASFEIYINTNGTKYYVCNI